MPRRPLLGMPSFPLRPMELAAMAVLVLACSQVGYVGHPRYGPFIAAADIALALLVPVWLIRLIRQGRRPQLHWPPTALAAWLLVGLLSISRSCLDDDGALSLAGVKSGVIELAQIALYFGFAWMLFVHVLNNTLKVHRAATVLLIATTVAVIWALAHYLTQPDPLQVRAGFGNRNAYSAFLLMVLPLLFGMALHGRDSLRRVWTYAICAIAAVTMLGPPHVWLLAAILAWMAWLRGGAARTAIVPCLIGLILATTAFLPRNHAANISEFSDVFDRGELHKLDIGEAASPPAAADEASPEEPADAEDAGPVVKKRWLEWQPALAMIAENLPLGVGAGSYQSRIGEARYYGELPNLNKTEPDSGNLYLVIGASMGVLGLIALLSYMMHFSYLAASLWLRAESSLQRGLAAGLAGSVAAIWLASLFTSLFVRGTSIVWAFIFAAVYVMSCETALPKSED